MPFDADAEFDRQVRTLIDNGYPKLTDLDDDAYAALLEPLRETVTTHEAMAEPEEGLVPFVLVVTRELAPLYDVVPRLTLGGRKTKPGVVDHNYAEGELVRFVAAKEVELPDARAYVLFDIQRGEEFCGAVPNDAMATIADRDRTLLTIEEGLSLVQQFPSILAKNKCFSLGGSRCGDKRVPAIWISQNAPKLGWCWQGNPHTWLGMASAAGRDGSLG
ncbi:hypothetical protein J4573_03595 [Actinomadura barringtoniae]|uniref:Uncharacterized protein n=1 Tax=Actinomadura barringtoniae TaxID=1427535 RepID=A0A939PAR8_9ACTN|nr:DUF5701 family protein [Actinomadura barringtoniae]MBO2446159.1 hypothetical protein [Actinomadura barringtoniae]